MSIFILNIKEILKILMQFKITITTTIKITGNYQTKSLFETKLYRAKVTFH